jgi:hypothetical protein
MKMKDRGIKEEDYVIRVRPSIENKSEWTGEIDISIMTGENNPLDDNSYYQVMHFVKMLCATVPLMEQDESIRDKLHSFVMDEFDNEIEEEYDEPDVIVEQSDGNVVKLNFTSRTKGSA